MKTILKKKKQRNEDLDNYPNAKCAILDMEYDLENEYGVRVKSRQVLDFFKQ